MSIASEKKSEYHYISETFFSFILCHECDNLPFKKGVFFLFLRRLPILIRLLMCAFYTFLWVVFCGIFTGVLIDR